MFVDYSNKSVADHYEKVNRILDEMSEAAWELNLQARGLTKHCDTGYYTKKQHDAALARYNGNKEELGRVVYSVRARLAGILRKIRESAKRLMVA